MRKFIPSLLFTLIFLLPATAQTIVPETHQHLVQRVYGAVTLLYSQDESGGMHMHCTATAYRKVDKGYRFASASHCVSGDTDEDQAETHYFVTSDSTGTKSFIAARLVGAGDKNVGDDFSIFEVTTDAKFEIVELGDSAKVQPGSEVLDVASPLGLGKQLFLGFVSAPLLDRPALDAGSVKWDHVMLVYIGSAPGSSGSAIVSEDQKAIVGFLVGGFNANIGAIVVPVAKFKTFEEKLDAHTYKKTHRYFFGLFGGA